jgi:DNA-binding response OmpR family regulator
MRIGILEDDPDQARFIHETLTSAGHICHDFADGRTLVKALQWQTFDLLALDWEVPGMAGDEVLNWVRRRFTEHVPIVFLTVHNREPDLVSILNAGADDYMVKPVCAAVLLARINALLRRAYRIDATATRTSFGAFEFDLSLRQISNRGVQVAVTQREFALALLLFRNMGRPLSRAHIRDIVWRQATEVPSRTMDTHVSSLRTKLGLRPENGYCLTPIYGYGYRLEQTGTQAARLLNDEKPILKALSH